MKADPTRRTRDLVRSRVACAEGLGLLGAGGCGCGREVTGFEAAQAEFLFDLAAFGLGALAVAVGAGTDFHDHFSLVRHIYAEAGHVPAELLEAWQEAGPRAVRRTLAARMGALDETGLIDAHGDPAQAAAHFVTLASTDITHGSYWGVLPLPRQEMDRITEVGVRAFLRAYAPA